MFKPRTPRIVTLVTLMVVFAAVPVIGQMDWKQSLPGQSPSARCLHAMAYDAARQRVVLFGGRDASSAKLNDTWEWDGTTWANVTPNPPAISPPARNGHAMAFDAARRRVVLFGGWSSPTGFNDTWEWDGQNWTQCNPTKSPAARRYHALAYDAFRGRVVLFGGWDGTKQVNDTWEWDGQKQNWTPCNPTTSPAARNTHAMAYDAARRQVVLFGGWDGTNRFNDTWLWDGQKQNWSQCNPTMSPIARSGHAMAYDTAGQRVVLFGGGQVAQYLNDTWTWDGRNWTPCNPATSPPGRTIFGMAFDAVRGAMVIFGGRTVPLSDTWEYAPIDLTALTYVVSVATGGNAALTINAGTNHAGRFYLVSGCMDGGGPRGIPSLPVSLLLNPDPYFWFNLVFPNTLIQNSLGKLDASGKATATVQVPKLPSSLIGFRFYHAYVVFQSSIDYASTPVPLTLI